MFTAVVVALLGVGRPNPSSAQLDTCRITDARASVFTALNQGGSVLYYGHALMATDGCGRGPVTIEATFRPVTGEATTCSPISSVFFAEAVCTYAYSAAIQGTQVAVSGTGKATGSGGADTFNSSCTLIVAAEGRSSCSFPLE